MSRIYFGKAFRETFSAPPGTRAVLREYHEKEELMETGFTLKEVDVVEVVTLQDNYIEITAQDNSDIISRASALKDGEIKNSIQAEHGFSAFVTTTAADERRTLLFDFGFSPQGAAYNAKALGVTMNDIEVLALSHGHSDHTGGLEAIRAMIDADSIDLVCHPAAFESPRYLEPFPDFKLYFPRFSREDLDRLNIRAVATKAPIPLTGGNALFLGEIERTNDFEKGFPIARREKDGVAEWDPIEDDSAIVMNLKGKGLVVISGCAHAGIINTVTYAKKVTGVDKVHAVMGGFHLSGPYFEQIIPQTVNALIALNPDYVIPCHCTGRNAVMAVEQAMPDHFILNMSGTKLTFKA